MRAVLTCAIRSAPCAKKSRESGERKIFHPRKVLCQKVLDGLGQREITISERNLEGRWCLSLPFSSLAALFSLVVSSIKGVGRRRRPLRRPTAPLERGPCQHSSYFLPPFHTALTLIANNASTDTLTKKEWEKNLFFLLFRQADRRHYNGGLGGYATLTIYWGNLFHQGSRQSCYTRL